MNCLRKAINSRTGEAWKHHQIEMAIGWMAPLPELLRQGMMLADQGPGLQILEPLMHQIKGVVNQLGSLFRRHGGAPLEWIDLTIVIIEEGFRDAPCHWL